MYGSRHLTQEDMIKVSSLVAMSGGMTLWHNHYTPSSGAPGVCKGMQSSAPTLHQSPSPSLKSTHTPALVDDQQTCCKARKQILSFPKP